MIGETKRVVTVVRQLHLANCPPVVSATFIIENDTTLAEIKRLVSEHREEFIKRFVEFGNAVWWDYVSEPFATDIISDTPEAFKLESTPL